MGRRHEQTRHLGRCQRDVARHAHDPTDRPWGAAYEIPTNSKGTRELGITLCRYTTDKLQAFADSPNAPHGDDSRSTSV